MLPAIVETGGGDVATVYSTAQDGDIGSMDVVWPGYASYERAWNGTGRNLTGLPGEPLQVHATQVAATVGQYHEPYSPYGPDLYEIYRGVLPFDTSGLGEAVIESAALSMWIHLPGGTGSEADWDLVTVEYTGSLPFTTSDWANFGAVSGGAIAKSSMAHRAYNVLSLNPTGLGWLNPKGTTVLGLRSSADIAYTPPDEWDWTFVAISTVESANPPYLSITYSVATGPSMSVNIGGAWKQVSGVWVNIGGTWRAGEEVYCNIGGTWRKSD